jgi:predicted peptidase
MVSSHKLQSNLLLNDEPPLRYLLAVPDGEPPKSGWPVLCFLHGYDEAAPLDIHEALTRHGPLWPQADLRARREFIVVAPQLPTGGDLWHRHADDVRGIVDEVQQRYVGDVQRLYLSGFSFGGNGVFDLAIDQSDLWTALWAVDPTRVPRQDIQRPVWLSIGDAARRSTPGFVRSLGLEPLEGDNPHGERWYLDQGADHVGSAQLAYSDARIYAWLLAHSRQEPA